MLTPEQIIHRLEQIEQDLADRQPRLEAAAEATTRIERERELAEARAYAAAEGQVTDRKMAATLATEEIGTEEEAQYEALKRAVAVLETRASIGQSLLRAHGRLDGPTPAGQTYGRQAA